MDVDRSHNPDRSALCLLVVLLALGLLSSDVWAQAGGTLRDDAGSNGEPPASADRAGNPAGTESTTEADVGVSWDVLKDPSSIEIVGNFVYNRETYLAIIRLAPDAPPAVDPRAWLRLKILDFLQEAGYELAEIQFYQKDGKLVLKVDEGRLEKVLFLGTGTFKALQLKLALKIPYAVFNRLELERQLEELGEQYGMRDVRWELTACEHVEHVSPQLDYIGEIQGIPVIPASAGYELRIHLGSQEWNTGFGAKLDYDFPDGLGINVRYKGAGMILDGDRVLFNNKIGGALRKRIDNRESYPVFTRLGGEVRWYTPRFLKGLRTSVWLITDMISRQRRDLAIEGYYRERFEASLNLSYDFAEGMTIAVGGGADERWLFWIEMVEYAWQPLGEGHWSRPFVAGRLEFVFDTKELRKDRHHTLEVEMRHAWVDGKRSIGTVHYRYQKVFGVGWHDFVIGSRGKWVFGATIFDDEEPVGGRSVRGVFGDQWWVERVANLSLEFRFSITRDLFKVSIYHDLAVFGELLREEKKEPPRLANSFGMGFHALVLDIFQIDIYYGVGFGSEDAFDHGLSAGVSKVF